MNYYNENDPYAAQWLRNLIAEGLIPKGDVDDRSIVDVKGKDLEGYIQCHFFCGIAGWPYALELAGWPPDRPVWTGSCPCPPFSVAGQKDPCPKCGSKLLVPCPRRTGYFICADCEHSWFADERHLWPEFWRLISECQPPVVFGEQVASSDGRIWLSGVRAGLEICGYAVGAVDIPACGIGAPHIRQRLWWVADAERDGRGTDEPGRGPQGRAFDGGTGGGLADADSERRTGKRVLLRAEETGRHEEEISEATGSGEAGRVGDTGQSGREGCDGPGDLELHGGTGPIRSAWATGALIPCLDGKARRVEPGICPLAHGVPRRVGALKAYGNAIVPQVAAEFVMAFMECRP